MTTVSTNTNINQPVDTVLPSLYNTHIHLMYVLLKKVNVQWTVQDQTMV